MSGKIELKYPQLNFQSINSVLGDFPFVLTDGVVENISVVVPWSDLLNGKMKVDITSLDLTFTFKDNHKNSAEMLSSVKDSILGERNSEVLATSVFIGELRKSDVHEEFKQEKTNFDVNDDEEIIARIIEGIIGSLKATISKVTLRFEFPNLTNNSKTVVAVFHIPELVYEDKTPMPSKNESWYPSFFKYELKFSQFYAQLFEEDKKDDKTVLQHKNTMIFGDSENIVNVKLKPGEFNKQSSLDVECIIPSIHSIIKPNQIDMITKLFNLVQSFISKDENEQENEDDEDEFSDLMHDPLERESSLDQATIDSLLNKENSQFGKQSQFQIDSQYDTQFKNFDYSKKNVGSEEFFSDSDSEFDSFNEKSAPTKSLNNSPINFTLRVVLLNTSTFNIVYKDIDLKNIWSFKTKPNINDDHLSAQVGESNFLFSSINGKNLIDFKMNDFEIKEHLFNKQESTKYSNTILQFEKNPNVEFQFETKKKVNSISLQIAPIIINLDIDFKTRISNLLKFVHTNLSGSKLSSPKMSRKSLKDSKILDDLDRNLDNIPRGLDIEINVYSIKINILYPEDDFKRKLKLKTDTLLIDLNNLKLSTKMNSEKKNTKWKGEIDSGSICLNDKKIISAFADEQKKIEIAFTTNDLIKTEILLNELEKDLSQSSILFNDQDSLFGRKYDASDEEDDEGDYLKKATNNESNDEKDWFEMGETLDKKVELYRKVDKSEVVLEVAISKILMDCTEQQLKKFHYLMVDLLMKFSATTEIKTTTNSSNPELSVFNQNSKEIPKTGIKVQISEIEVLLKDVMSETFKYHSFQFLLTDFILMTMIHSSMLEVYIRNQKLEVNKIVNSTRIPLVRKYERMIKNFRKNKESILLNLTYTEAKNLVSIVAQLQFNGLYINHGNDTSDENWIVLLTKLISSEPSEEQFITNLYVLLQDTAIDYKPLELKSRLLVVMNELKFSTNLINLNAKSNDFLIEMKDIVCLLKNDHSTDIITDLENKKQTMLFEKDLIDFLDFIQIANVNSVEIKVVMLTDAQKSTVNTPPLSVEISKSTLKFDACSDSLQTLMEILRNFMKGKPKSSKSDVQVTKTSTTFIQDTIEINLKENMIDITKFEKKLTPTSTEKKKIVSQVKTSDSQVKLFNNISMINIMDNYFSNTKIEEKPKLSDSYSLPEFELLITEDINIECCLYGGEDWKKERDTSKVLKLSLIEFFLQFHLFKENQEHNWRFQIKAKDLEIKDEILTSERNLFLCYLKDEKNPREDGSNMLEILVEGVGFPKEELKVDIKVLPLRLNVHQQTLMFLMEFMNNTTGSTVQQEEKLEENQKFSRHGSSPKVKEEIIEVLDDEDFETYFQSFTISPLSFKIDYQPVSVNFSGLKQGNWSELSNLIPLSGIELNFDKIKLLGVSGQAKLIETIVQKNYLPKLQEKGQLFKFALGIIPVKSIYNVSTGILDLVLMPVVKYNKDGQFLRGVKNGFSSFVRNISIETMGLTANTLTGANATIRVINEALDEEKVKKTTKSIPNNLSDGMNEAYKSISTGVSNSVNALVSISNDPDSIAKRTVRAVPIAILSPILGTSEALTNILQGVRVWIDPTIKEENDQIFKS